MSEERGQESREENTKLSIYHRHTYSPFSNILHMQGILAAKIKLYLASIVWEFPTLPNCSMPLFLNMMALCQQSTLSQIIVTNSLQFRRPLDHRQSSGNMSKNWSSCYQSSFWQSWPSCCEFSNSSSPACLPLHLYRQNVSHGRLTVSPMTLILQPCSSSYWACFYLFILLLMFSVKRFASILVAKALLRLSFMMEAVLIYKYWYWKLFRKPSNKSKNTLWLPPRWWRCSGDG